ncbi:hypothetical protein [Clostridium felsineum]|uniref:Glucosyltransferase 3 n=1 Tax=Clostridium felsineum TaxID=36839 RepID=A0A1S8KY26_9CLOT|nr:hypothetical protein [Clostridium felsineum]URZ08146.1 Glucosyltransferase 3 [Clostridium felsineum]URZ13177.1 Glucosyltransferase 3 [Clostridium felsineum]
MSEKFIADFKTNYGFNADFKAKSDIDFFLKQNQFNRVLIYHGNNKFEKIISFFINTIRNIVKSRNKPKIVIIQYPTVKSSLFKIYKKCINKNNTIFICLIHDLECIRLGWNTSNYEYKIKNEIKALNLYDYVISHNSKMSKWLKDNGAKSSVLNLNLFDYKVNLKKNKGSNMESGKMNSIVYAGNLSSKKSYFLYKLNQLEFSTVKFCLYGTNFEKNKFLNSSNIEYMGFYDAAELPTVIQGSYGLVWDGDDVFECSGNTGNYMRYNNPHKLSLYIASGVPVIVWNQAAIAEFVEFNNIGIVISNLSEIEEKVRNINDEQYKIMKNNIYELSKKIVKGYYIKNVINEIISDINLENGEKKDEV